MPKKITRTARSLLEDSLNKLLNLNIADPKIVEMRDKILEKVAESIPVVEPPTEIIVPIDQPTHTIITNSHKDNTIKLLPPVKLSKRMSHINGFITLGIDPSAFIPLELFKLLSVPQILMLPDWEVIAYYDGYLIKIDYLHTWQWNDLRRNAQPEPHNREELIPLMARSRDIIAENPEFFNVKKFTNDEIAHIRRSLADHDRDFWTTVSTIKTNLNAKYGNQTIKYNLDTLLADDSTEIKETEAPTPANNTWRIYVDNTLTRATAGISLHDLRQRLDTLTYQYTDLVNNYVLNTVYGNYRNLLTNLQNSIDHKIEAHIRDYTNTSGATNEQIITYNDLIDKFYNMERGIIKRRDHA